MRAVVRDLRLCYHELLAYELAEAACPAPLDDVGFTHSAGALSLHAFTQVTPVRLSALALALRWSLHPGAVHAADRVAKREHVALRHSDKKVAVWLLQRAVEREHARVLSEDEPRLDDELLLPSGRRSLQVAKLREAGLEGDEAEALGSGSLEEHEDLLVRLCLKQPVALRE